MDLANQWSQQTLIHYIKDNPIRMGFAAVFSCFIMKLVMSVVLYPFLDFEDAHQPVFDDILMCGLLWLLWLPVETMIGQAFPYFVLRKLAVTSPIGVVAISAAFFSALHLTYGPVVAGVLYGPSLVFSLLWFAYRRISFCYALVGVTAVHYVHNMICLLLP